MAKAPNLEKKNLNFIPSKIWKLNPNKDNVEEIIGQLFQLKKGSNMHVMIKGKKLEDDSCLEVELL